MDNKKLYIFTKLKYHKKSSCYTSRIITCNDLYNLKSKEDISFIIDKYDTIRFNRYKIVKDKDIFFKKLRKHIFHFKLAGIITSINVSKKELCYSMKEEV
jgi:hypothetical protein